MRFESYRDVRDQPDETVQALLRSGDGAERVWAAWTIGLRVGGDATPTLGTGEQPDPGVRSQLIVILAGFGHGDILRALATGDPDAGVRATACDYLVRIASPETRGETERFLEQRLLDESEPEPVLRVIARLPDGWPPLRPETMRVLLANSVLEVRVAALRYLEERAYHPRVSDELLRERLTAESSASVLERVAGLLDPRAETSLLLAASMRVPSAAPALLDMIVRSDQEVDWNDLGGLPLESDVRVQLCCLKLCGNPAHEWLNTLLVEETNRASWVKWAFPRSPSDEVQAAVRSRILSLLASPDLEDIPALLPALQCMSRELGGFEAYLGGIDPEYDHEVQEIAERIDDIRSKRNLVQRALVRETDAL